MDEERRSFLTSTPWRKLSWTTKSPPDASTSEDWLLLKCKETQQGTRYVVSVSDCACIYVFAATAASIAEDSMSLLRKSVDEVKVVALVMKILTEGLVANWQPGHGVDCSAKRATLTLKWKHEAGMTFSKSLDLLEVDSSFCRVREAICIPALQTLAVLVTEKQKLLETIAAKEREIELRKSTPSNQMRRSDITAEFERSLLEQNCFNVAKESKFSSIATIRWQEINCSLDSSANIVPTQHSLAVGEKLQLESPPRQQTSAPHEIQPIQAPTPPSPEAPLQIATIAKAGDGFKKKKARKL